MNEFEPERYSIEDLSLYRGEYLGSKVIILVVGERMAISSDIGSVDLWRNNIIIDLSYLYSPLNLSKFTNLEKIW